MTYLCINYREIRKNYRDLTDCPLTGLKDATYAYFATTTAQQLENAPCNYQAQHSGIAQPFLEDK
jgi:hypothetical protein